MIFSVRFVLFCAFLVSALGQQLETGTFKNCESTGTIVKLEVFPCPNGPSCPLKRGTNSSVAITFKLREPAEKLQVFVYGVIGPVDIEFGGINQDACLAVFEETTNATACPVKDSTKTFVFRSFVEVLTVYPTFPLDIKFKIVDTAKPTESIVCIQFGAKIIAEDATTP